MRKPRKGARKTTKSRSNITRTSAFHLGGGIRIERTKATVELQQYGEAHAGFGGGERENQNEHHLPVRLPPATARGDEGQRRRVHHDLDRHQYEQEIAPDENAEQAEREQNPGEEQCVCERYGDHPRLPTWNAATSAASNNIEASSTASR